MNSNAIAKRLNFDLTDKCNARCIMCSVSSHRGRSEMEKELAMGPLIRELTRCEVSQFGCAFEPLTCSYALEFINKCSAAGVRRMDLQTNASLLNPVLCDAIAGSQVFSTVKVSCDGPDRETFEKIRVGLRFDDVMENVQLLSCAARSMSSSLRIVFVYTLQPGNLSGLAAMKQLANSMGASEIIVHRVNNMQVPEWFTDDFCIHFAKQCLGDSTMIAGLDKRVYGAPTREEYVRCDLHGTLFDANNTKVGLLSQ